MKCRYLCSLFLSIFTLSCAQHPVPSLPPPASAQAIAVLPPNNRTGDPLPVFGSAFWDLFASCSPGVTVADVVAAEARLQLEQRGFTVASPEAVEAAVGTHTPGSPEEAADMARGKLEGDVFYIEIKRWEPADMSTLSPKQILVALEANLIEVTTGRVVWTAHRPLRPVPTPGAINSSSADMIAAHAVVEELLAPWGPTQPAS